MKKLITLLLVTVLACSLLAGCGGGIIGSILGRTNGISESDRNMISGILDDLGSVVDSSLSVSNSGSTSSSDSSAAQSKNSKDEEDFEYGNGKDFIAKNLTGDYSITYTLYSDGSDETAEVFAVRTSEGYYIGNFTSKSLYIKNSDGLYETYFNSDEGFYKVEFLDPITEEEVQKNLVVIIDMMTKYSGANDLHRDGTETVAGRDCDRYKASASGFGFAAGVSFCIDKKTGACLKFRYDMAGEDGMANMTFECTEFKTSGVKLPAYK